MRTVSEKTGSVNFGTRGIYEVTVRLQRTECEAERTGMITDQTVIDNSSNWSVLISTTGRKQEPKFATKNEAVKFFNEQCAKLGG